MARTPEQIAALVEQAARNPEGKVMLRHVSGKQYARYADSAADMLADESFWPVGVELDPPLLHGLPLVGGPDVPLPPPGDEPPVLGYSDAKPSKKGKAK